MILRDPCLREWGDGGPTRPVAEIAREKPRRPCEPFLNRERHDLMLVGVKMFLDDLPAAHAGTWALVVGHRPTNHGLDHRLAGVPLS